MPPKKGKGKGKGIKRLLPTEESDKEDTASVVSVASGGTDAAASDATTVEQAGPSTATGPPPKRKKRTPVTLNDEQEELAVDFIKNHELLYNRKLRDYKDTAKRDRVWQELATQLGLDAKDVKQWFESQRTVYGKCTKTKSGQAATGENLSERKLWTVRNFAFLHHHIQRQSSISTLRTARKELRDVVSECDHDSDSTVHSVSRLASSAVSHFNHFVSPARE